MASPTPPIHATRPRSGLRLWLLFRRACVAAYEDNCFGIAKGAAYSSLLAFFPVLTTLATLLVQANAAAVTRVLSQLLFEVVPPGSENLVLRHFVAVGPRPLLLLAVGTMFTVWTASGAMMSLMEGFQAAYRLPSGRPFLWQRGTAVLLVIVAAGPLLAASALILFGARAEQVFLRQLGFTPEGAELRGWVVLLGHVSGYVVAIAAIVLATALMYYFGPNRKQSLRRVLPGAALATVLWLIATSVFAWYVRNVANYTVLYGSIAAAVALLVWMYVLAVIALVGCEFNSAAERLWRHASS